jgi:hypothetical protein
MARHLGLLPGRQFGVGFFEGSFRLLLQQFDFIVNRNRPVLAFQRFQILDLAFQLGDRFFEIEIGAYHHQGCVAQKQLAVREHEAPRHR